MRRGNHEEKRKINKWKIYSVIITIIAAAVFGWDIGLSIGDNMLKEEYHKQKAYIRYLEDNLPAVVYKSKKGKYEAQT